MDEFDELLGIGWRTALAKVLRDFLAVFQDIRDTQNQRLVVEEQMLEQMKLANHNPPEKFIVQLGTPVSQ